jgi:hypothetical protein
MTWVAAEVERTPAFNAHVLAGWAAGLDLATDERQQRPADGGGLLHL